MSDRRFWMFDTALCVAATTGEVDKRMGWNRVDYETFNRLMTALEGVGFTVGSDPQIDRNFPTLSKWHRAGTRPTPAGMLHFEAETYPTGCKVEFFQEIVTVNPNGGRYDFDRLQKMPYLIRKAFQLAIDTAAAHLEGRGFSRTEKVRSPNPDPLAWFNSTWDSDFERARGVHRFERDETGWPSAKELSSWVRPGQPLLEPGSVHYFRDRGGRLMRGRCYGGINGMWTVVYGPGPRDFTNLSRGEIFDCNPSEVPRRVHPHGPARLQAALKAAVEESNFERAIVLRDTIARAA